MTAIRKPSICRFWALLVNLTQQPLENGSLSVYMIMGKTITTVLVVLLLVIGGFWLFNRGDENLARDNDVNATTTDFTGIGGPDEGFDPLEGLDGNDEEVDSMEGKG